MNHRDLAALCWMGLCLTGCGEKAPEATTQAGQAKAGEKAPSEETTTRIRQRARGLLAPVKRNLKGALTEGMAEGGPAGAVEACRIKAPGIAAAASGKQVKLGRSALKLRNPQNAPAPWMKPILEKYASGPASSGSYEVVALGGGRYGYAEPIYTGTMCTACHGEAIAPEVKAALAQSYPEDQATGFKPGQLRGIFWVELPL